MKPELEALLKAYDAFKQTPDGPEAKLEEASLDTSLNRETLHNAVSRFHQRWVRANLPLGFPKKLGLE